MPLVREIFHAHCKKCGRETEHIPGSGSVHRELKCSKCGRVNYFYDDTESEPCDFVDADTGREVDVDYD